MPPEIQWLLNFVVVTGVLGMARWTYSIKEDLSKFKQDVAEKYANKDDLRHIIGAAIAPVTNDLGWIKQHMTKLEEKVSVHDK